MPALFFLVAVAHPYPRIASVDFGMRRVGIAVADPLRLFAQPLGTFSPDEAIERLARLAAEEGLETIVVGWPLNMEGEEGPATRRVTPFLNRLRKAFRAVDIVRWDERESSRRAVDSLVQAGVRKKGRREKGRIDRAAAAIILQEFLDESRSPTTHDPSDT
jgi:putative holliday junction resolvase